MVNRIIPRESRHESSHIGANVGAAQRVGEPDAIQSIGLRLHYHGYLRRTIAQDASIRVDIATQNLGSVKGTL